MTISTSLIRVLLISCVLGLLQAACTDSDADPRAKLNAEQGKTFLKQNRHSAGVVVLDSGLQYRVLSSGNGAPVRITDTVDLHYNGMHLDGSQFDSTYERGEPVNIRVKAMIPGLKQALLRMHEGDKWRLFIPHFLAYTNRGTEGIAPNETLIYELEIVRIN